MTTYMRRTLAPYLWWVVITLALSLALWFAGRSTVTSIRQDERAKVLAEGERLGSSVAQTRERLADATAKAHTDTVRVRVMQTRWRVDTLVRNLPDSVRTLPAVSNLVAIIDTLTTQVDALDRALDLERAASTLRAQVDSAAIVSLRIVNTEQERTIVQLKKRPTWAKLGASAVLGAALGFVVGVVR